MSLAELDDPAPLWLYGIRRAGASREVDPVPLPGGGAPGLAPVGPLEILAGRPPEGEVRRTRRNMLAHARALERAAEVSAILPMRFGVIASAQEAAAAVSGQAQTLLSRLDEIEGLAEYGLRVAWPEAEVFAALSAARPDLADARARLEARGGGARDAMIDLGRRVSEALSDRRQTAQKTLVRLVAEQVRDHRLRAPETPFEALRAEALLPRGEEDSLLERLRACAETLDFGRGPPEIRCIGPSAPFNFVDISLSPDGVGAAGHGG